MVKPQKDVKYPGKQKAGEIFTERNEKENHLNQTFP